MGQFCDTMFKGGGGFVIQETHLIERLEFVMPLNFRVQKNKHYKTKA